MVKALFLLCLLLCGQLQAAEQEILLEVKPLVCVRQGEQHCSVQLTLSWKAAEPLCLYLSSAPSQAVVCQARADQIPLSLQLSDNLLVRLQRASDQTIVAEREVKVMHVSAHQENLHKRRLSWGIF